MASIFHPGRFTALVCALSASTAFAQGFAGQPEFDKSSYFVNETATLSMKGKGLCKGIEIDWGDGSITSIASWDFGAAVGQKNLFSPHQYANAQKFFPSIKTKPGPTQAQQCGSSSTSVTVVWPGKVSKVYAAPAPATVGQPVDLVVEGAGVCPADAVIKVTPESGGASQTVGGVFKKDAAWPHKVSFTPTVVGTYYIGQAVAPGQNVAASVGCFSLPAGSDGKFVVQAAATPAIPAGTGGTVTSIDGKPVGTPPARDGASSKIDHTLGLEIMKPGSSSAPCAISVSSVSPASVKPGDQFTINGCGFGYVNGKAQLDGNFPGGVLNLVVKDWTDSKIVAALAPDISGVPDQSVTLEVKTNNNVTTAKPGVQFVALRETRDLTLADFTTKDYSHGLVNSVVQGGGPPTYMCAASICAKQKVAAVQTPPFNGDDHFQLTLKNGWVYASHVFDGADSGSDVDLFNCAIPSGVAPKPTLLEANTGSPLSFRVHNVFWGCLSWTTYRLKVTVSGPKGVAFN